MIPVFPIDLPLNLLKFTEGVNALRWKKLFAVGPQGPFSVSESSRRLLQTFLQLLGSLIFYFPMTK